MVISKDSTDLILYVKKTKTDKKFDSLIKQWESRINKTDSSYRFSRVEQT